MLPKKKTGNLLGQTGRPRLTRERESYCLRYVAKDAATLAFLGDGISVRRRCGIRSMFVNMSTWPNTETGCKFTLVRSKNFSPPSRAPAGSSSNPPPDCQNANPALCFAAAEQFTSPVSTSSSIHALRLVLRTQSCSENSNGIPSISPSFHLGASAR